MTPLSRPVRRRIPTARRDLVLSLSLEGSTAVVSVREAGRRTSFAVTVEGLYAILARRSADAIVAERAAKRAKRGPK
jgi:hypothetical protein